MSNFTYKKEDPIAMMTQFASWGLPQTMVVAKDPKISMEEAFRRRIDNDVVAAGASPKTVRHCEYIGRLATDFFGKDKEMTTLDIDDVLNYHDHLTSWLRPDTVRKALTDLKCVLRWCAMRGYRVLHPDFIKVSCRHAPNTPSRSTSSLVRTRTRHYSCLRKKKSA